MFLKSVISFLGTRVNEISFLGTRANEISFLGARVNGISFLGTRVNEISFLGARVNEISFLGTGVNEIPLIPISEVCPSAKIFTKSQTHVGDRASTVVKVLCYKSEGRWFYPSRCQWIFH